ncbi:MAG: tetratricopeptide repeat protein [Myxococcota bacterium]|nr:tetratricopeptide repeat protein [Myxococcota bacterium]
MLSLTVSMAGLSVIPAQLTYAAQTSVAAQTAHAEGVKQFKQKQYPEAVTNFRRAIKFSPEFAEAWTDLANTYLATRDLINAEEAFVNANRLQPTNMAVAYNLAYVLRKLEKYDRAIKAYGVYIAEKPDDADAQYGLAEALRANQENLRAAAAYRRYASLEKRKDRAKWRKKALSFAAELETAGSKKPKAEAPPAPKLDVAVEAPPETKTAEKSEAPAEKDPVSTRDATQMFSDGLTALKAKKFDLAIKSLTDASTKLPNPDAAFFAALGSAYLGKRDSAAAVESYKRALSLLDKRGADFASIAQISIEFGLAEAYRMSENDKMAAELYRKVLSNDKSPAQLQVAAKRHLESLNS